MVRSNEKLWLTSLAAVLAGAPMSVVQAQTDVGFSCPECVDAADLADGSVGEAKLDAALAARLADMEARIAALETGSVGSPGFAGTYRCYELQVDQFAGLDFAGMNLQGERILIDADGAGTASYTVSEDDGSLTWSVEGGALQSNWSDITDPDFTGSFTYAVSPDGQLSFDGQEWGWLSHNGDFATSLFVNTDYTGFGIGIGLTVCVRTVLP